MGLRLFSSVCSSSIRANILHLAFYHFGLHASNKFNSAHMRDSERGSNVCLTSLRE